VYRETGQLEQAVMLQEEMLRTMKETLGEHHSDTIIMSSNLAVTYCAMGQLKKAKALQEEVLRIMKDLRGSLTLILSPQPPAWQSLIET
jgi:hypothetical protein